MKKEEFKEMMKSAYIQMLSEAKLSDEDIVNYGGIIEKSFNCGYIAGVMETQNK